MTIEISQRDLRGLVADCLRHEPERFSVQLTDQGYVDLMTLQRGLNECTPYSVSHEQLVDACESSMFDYDPEANWVRAVSGHTTDQFEYPETEPPEYLFYLVRNDPTDLKVIRDTTGLAPWGQRYLPLEKTREDALSTQKKRRIGNPVVIRVHARDAFHGGVSFYQYCDNWYSRHVDPEYLRFEDSE